MDGTPPTLVVTIGVPAAAASRSTIGIPSVLELSTSMSKAASSAPAPRTTPCQRTRSATPKLLARSRRAASSGPPPTIDTAGSGRARSGMASMKTSGPFSALSRPTQPTASSPLGMPSRSRAAARPTTEAEPSNALGITWIRARSTPRRSRRCAMSPETATTASKSRKARSCIHSYTRLRSPPPVKPWTVDTVGMPAERATPPSTTSER